MSSNLLDQFGTMASALRKRGLFTLIAAILGVLLLIQLIRLAWLFITPLGPVGGWQAQDVQVLSPESRLALFSSFDPFFRTANGADANVVTSLQLTLYGIRMNEASGLGAAILAGTDGVQENYAIGDEILPGVTLEAVRFDHVIIDRGGTRESLYLDQSVPAEVVGTEPVSSETTAEPPIIAESKEEQTEPTE